VKTTSVLKSSTATLWLSHKTEQHMLWGLLCNTAQRDWEPSGNSCWLGDIPMHPSCTRQALCTFLLCESLCLFHHSTLRQLWSREGQEEEHPRLNVDGSLPCKGGPKKLQTENLLRRVPTSPLGIARGHG